MAQPWMLVGVMAFCLAVIAFGLYLIAMLTNRNARRSLGLSFLLLPGAISVGMLHFVIPVPTRTSQALTVVSILLTLAWLWLWLRVRASYSKQP